MIKLKTLHPSYMLIHIENIKKNLKALKNYSPDTVVMPVIKNDAYRHGAIEIAKIIEEEGFDILAVARINEALELRKSGIKCDILILGYTPNYLFESLIKANIIPTIFSLEDAINLNTTAIDLNKKVKCHIKIDTGMSRLGFLTNETSIKEILYIKNKLKNLKLEAAFSHFSQSEIEDKSYSHYQFEEFINFLTHLESKGVIFKYKHISNAAGAIDLPEYNLDFVRHGISIFGLYPNYKKQKNKLDLKLSFTIMSEISQIKTIKKGSYISYNNTYKTKSDTKIAIIPIGYGDGYYQELAEKVGMFINGKKVNVLGRVCMDQTIIDVTGLDVETGQQVTVLNDQSVKFLNAKSLSFLSKRLAKIYMSEDKIIKVIDYF